MVVRLLNINVKIKIYIVQFRSTKNYIQKGYKVREIANPGIKGYFIPTIAFYKIKFLCKKSNSFTNMCLNYVLDFSDSLEIVYKSTFLQAIFSWGPGKLYYYYLHRLKRILTGTINKVNLVFLRKNCNLKGI